MKKVNYISLAALILMAASSTAYADGFAGPYAGVEAGYVTGQDKGTETFNGVINGWTENTKPDGGVHGVFGGYNWMVAPQFLMGVEADFEGRSQRKTSNLLLNGVPQSTDLIKVDVRYAASFRLRAGYVFNMDSTLAYVTAGYAGVDIERTFTNTIPPLTTNSVTSWENGWTVGAGAEHFFTPRVSGKFEYRYSKYGEKTVSAAGAFGSGIAEQMKYDDNTFQLGIVYHF